MKKPNKLNLLSYIVLKHEIRKGHLKWAVSQVAKEAKISRSWIYKYLGSTKEEILLNSVRQTVEDFFLISEERREILATKGLTAAFMRSREVLSLYPEVYAFYFMHYGRDNAYGKVIRHTEKDYFENHLMKRHQLKNPFQGSFLRAFSHGLATSFYLDSKMTETLMNFMLSPEFRTWLLQVPDLFEK